MKRGKLGALHKHPSPMRLAAGRAALAHHPVADYVDYTFGLVFDGSNPLGNDVLGNCVEAAFLQLARIRFNMVAHSDLAPTREQAIEVYTSWAGYDPGSPATDTGTDVLTALQKWGEFGLILVDNNLLDIGPWFSADPTDIQQIKAAVQFGVGALMTLDLYEGDDEDDGGTVFGNLTANAVSIGQHEVVCIGYNAEVVYLLTWDVVMTTTWSGLLSRLLAVSVPVSRIITDTLGKTAAGQTWTEALSTINGALSAA